MKSLFCVLLLAAVLRADSILIKNVTVIDGTGSPAARGMNVAIAGDRIREISKRPARAAKGTRVVDGSGKFLIPGLWDMHVHLWESEPMFGMYLANGITAVRDMGSDFTKVSRWRKAPLAPRVYTSGAPIDGKASNEPKLPIVAVGTAVQAQGAVDQLDDSGVDFIKVLSRLTADEYDAVAYRARVTRIPFAGHVPESVSVWHVLDARQRSVEHLFGFLTACSTAEDELRTMRGQVKTKADAEKYRALMESSYSEARALELFRRAATLGVELTPTLTMHARMYGIEVAGMSNDPRLKYVPEAIRKGWKEDPAEGLDKLSPEELEQRAHDFNRLVALVKVMRAARADILAGTDTGDAYVLPGFALHDELAWLVRAGLTPMEALQTATRNAAKAMNFGKDGGTVERGKVADLALLDADPQADIASARRVRAVILRGKYLDRKRLDRMLQGAEAVK